MIDVESKVYTPIAAALRSEFPGIKVSGEYVPAPSDFPYVSIVETDNFMTRSHMDNGSTERFARIVYEVNIYSNKAAMKKSECRAIAKVIDRIMYSMNFRRTALAPIPNMDNASIYRIVARYRAETDGENIYRG